MPTLIDPALAHSNIPMIAADFAARLLTEIGATNLSRAIIANRNDQSSLSCATHDYCDANMVMDATLAAHNVATDAPDGATADEETAFVIRRADLFNAVWCHWKRATASDPTFGIRDMLLTVHAWLTEVDRDQPEPRDPDFVADMRTEYPILCYLCDDNLVYIDADGQLEVFEGALQTPRLPKCARLLA